MKVLVAYFSQSGQTKKVAESIFNEIECEKEIRTISEISTLDGYDLIFVGFPVWRLGPADPAVHFLNSHADGKNIALFITHAMPYEMKKTENQAMLESLLKRCKACAAKANLLGFFHCRGELSREIASVLVKSDNPELRKFGKKRKSTIGHPDEDELEVAGIFTRDIMGIFETGSGYVK